MGPGASLPLFASAALKLVEEGASVVYALAALFVIVGSGSLFLGRELGRDARVPAALGVGVEERAADVDG